MLLKEVTEVRVWTHVLFSSLVLQMCCVAKYEGCCEEAGDELLCVGQERQFYMATRGNNSWQLASTALNLSYLHGTWNMNPEVLLHSGMFK